MDFRLYLILVVNFGLISAREWDNTVFTKPDNFSCGDESKCPNWSYTPTTGLNTAYIKFEEELEEPILIAVMHCTDCTKANVQIGEFDEGSRSLLGPEINEFEEGVFTLFINNKLDYEMPDQRQFKFKIILDGSAKTVKVQITLIDIDDNKPIITVDHSPCIIKENYDGDTDCKFTVTDADTINTIHSVKYIIPPEYEKHFEIVSNPIDNHNANGFLKVREESPLDFETMPMYFFELIAMDLGENNGTALIMIRVEDMNDQPPKWIDIFAMQSFDEHSKQTFTVYAQDGDLEIKDDIIYKWENDKCHESIILTAVADGKAIITTDGIERDTQEMEENDNTIKCVLMAFEKSSDKYNASTEVSFIIQDINDNKPLITLDPSYETIQLREEEFTTLDKIFNVADIDQGNNAMFDITLENIAGTKVEIDYAKSFQVIPNNGYRNWDFTISVIDPIDYDRNKDWREFSIKIQSKDKGEPSWTSEKIINIKLKNLNDEIPEFSTSIDYSVDIAEDAEEGAYILNVLAIDADEDDTVVYNIQAGTDYKLINEINNTATIRTNRDNVFDYEKVKVVFIQITATDTLEIPGEKTNLHTSSQQITVNVQDVNDEKPKIVLPIETLKIEEHSDIDSEVPTTTKIYAEDVDTTAHLEFGIDWENSRASKSGIQKPDISLFEDVFWIDTYFPDKSETGYAEGILKVKNNETLDYEKFDTIFLNIIVTDINQTKPDNTDKGTLTISIIDINDNAPEFDMNTIKSEKKVEERSNALLRIATIVANDIDGPDNNNVTYMLEPRNNTEDGLVKIDLITGDLMVDTNKAIDADYPNPIFSLYYVVIATDNEFNTTEDIEIKVQDTNNKKPYLYPELTDDFSIKERKSTDEIEHLEQKIQGQDDDRDAPHNEVKYYIDNEINPQLSKMFQINEDTGEVHALGDIKWNSNQKDIRVYVILEDNYKGQGDHNRVSINFNVRIIDIDNNPPVLPEEIIITKSVKENIEKEEISRIIATDEDEPCTKTTKIKYLIKEVKHNRNKEIDVDFFKLEAEEGPKPKCEQIAKLRVNKSLKDYYGTITITIQAQNTDNKENIDEKSYEIIVEPYNYKPPVIRIPEASVIILQKKQEVNKILRAIDGKYIKDFEADDDQGGKFELNFKSGDTWDDNFKLLFPNPDGDKNKARLTITKTVLPDKDYILQITAFHAGDVSSSQNSVNKTITVKLVDADQLPTFVTIEKTVKFWENETGLEDNNICQEFPSASDPKCNLKDDCQYKTFYHIVNVEEKVYFATEQGTPPNLCLNKELDRETKPYHYLTIVATNQKEAPVDVPEGYKPLKLTVEVQDINDNPPAFEIKFFKGGLADTNKIDSEIVELKASDPDTVDEGKLRYEMHFKSVSDPSLENIQTETFALKENLIINKFQPTQKMKGFFIYEVKVFDSSDFYDTAEVKIHIISDANRVIFKFSENIDDVREKKIAIEEILSNQFGYTCTIDDFTKVLNETTNEYETEVKTHFIDDEIDEPVDKGVITVKLTDVAIIGKLEIRLDDISLTLIRIYNNDNNDVTNEIKEMNDLLQILLIIVSVVLGTLCIILIVAFILRTRSLNNRLDAMTTNVFGSTKSDLNRIGTSAPGTNRHAIEANPVWNEEINNFNQYDTISQASGGSDLIGVEDKPDFDYDFRRASINPVIQQNLHKMSQQDDDDEIHSLPGSYNNNNNSAMF